MRKFDVVKKVSGVAAFSKIVFAMAMKAGSVEMLEKDLSSEIPEEGLQTIMSVAQKGNYPLSFDEMQ